MVARGGAQRDAMATGNQFGKASNSRKTIKSSKNYQQDKTPKCLFETGNQLEILGSNHHLPTGGRSKEKRPYKMNEL